MILYTLFLYIYHRVKTIEWLLCVIPPRGADLIIEVTDWLVFLQIIYKVPLLHRVQVSTEEKVKPASFR